MDQPAAPTPMTDREISVTMFGILTAMFLAALDQSIVTPAMPTIGGELGNPQYLPWIVTAYLLTATAVAPLYGKISDIYGRRRTLYAALGLFLLGSLLAALSPNIFVLIGARAIQGAGGGGLFALSQILIGDMLPPRERGKYAAWISGMWAVAGTAGPLLGGTLAEWHWSLIFWLNLPLGAIALMVIDRPLRKLHVVTRAHRLDTIGAGLLVAATTLLLLMLNWGGAIYPWLSPQVIGAGLAALVLFVGFGVRLTRASEPLVSLEVLSNKIVLAGCFAMFMVAGANVGLAVFLPIYGQAHFGLSPAGSGYALLGFLLGTTVGATISGRLTLRVERIKRVSIAGGLVAVVALLGMAIFVGQTSLWVLEALLVVVGVGLGTMFPVTTMSVQNGVDQMHLGVATGTLTFLRSLGSALGVAVLSAIALGYGIALAAEGSRQVARVDDPFPFAVLFVAVAAMMLAAVGFTILMPHKVLRGRAPVPAVVD
ncbi:MAG: MFS transporter [Devosia sp.]